jgi:hypothetical protein
MKRSALAPFLVGILLAFSLLYATAVFSIDRVTLADGSVVVVWSVAEMDKLEQVLTDLVHQRDEAQSAFLRLKKQCI